MGSPTVVKVNQKKLTDREVMWREWARLDKRLDVTRTYCELFLRAQDKNPTMDLTPIKDMILDQAKFEWGEDTLVLYEDNKIYVKNRQRMKKATMWLDWEESNHVYKEFFIEGVEE